MQQIDIRLTLKNNMRALSEVYKSTIYGAKHREVFIIRLLTKLESKYAKNISKSPEIKKALIELNVLDKVRKSKIVTVKFTNKEITGLRKNVRKVLKRQRTVPTLARRQIMISLASNLEIYISDTLKHIFTINKDSLKSENSTLKDSDIIEAVSDKNVLGALIDKKIRGLMYSEFENWIKYLRVNLGVDVRVPKQVKELFLVRNCIIHNNSKVSRELINKIKSKRYKFNKEVNLSENDYKRYFEATHDFGDKLEVKVIEKYEKIKIPYRKIKQKFCYEKEDTSANK